MAVECTKEEFKAVQLVGLIELFIKEVKNTNRTEKEAIASELSDALYSKEYQETDGAQLLWYVQQYVLRS